MMIFRGELSVLYADASAIYSDPSAPCSEVVRGLTAPSRVVHRTTWPPQSPVFGTRPWS